MQILRKFSRNLWLLLLLMSSVFCISAAATDCHDLSAEWFGSDRTDAGVLGLETTAVDPDISDLLDSYAQSRQQAFLTDATGTTSATAKNASPNSAAARAGLTVLDAERTTFVVDLTETETGYRATVYEWTFFDYDDLSDGAGGSDTAGYGTLHEMELGYDDAGSLVILSDTYQEGETRADGPVAVTGSTKASPAYNTAYNPILAALYADKWISHDPLPEGTTKDPTAYNPAYPNYASFGGDCANYVSQCLCAGGFPTDSTWQSGQMPWTYCPSMYLYFSQYGVSVKNPTDADIYPGSIVFFCDDDFGGDYYHVTICVGMNSAGRPIINGHTSDRYHFPWDYNIDDGAQYMTVQLTPYRLEHMETVPDTLLAAAETEVPLYSNYTDAAPAATASIDRDHGLSVLSRFDYLGATFYAVRQNDQVYYVPEAAGLYLQNQTAPKLTLPASADNNSQLEATVTVKGLTAESAVLVIGTAEFPMSVSGSSATVTVDLAGFSGGSYPIYAKVVTEIGELVSREDSLPITAMPSVSGSCGATSTWSLDKTTGVLTISGSGDVDPTGWSRFAQLITTVNIPYAITGVPTDAFSGSAIETIYGPLALTNLVEEYGDRYVNAGRFTDVLPSAWFFREVNDAAEQGLFKGVSDTLFAPAETMTRAMFVTVLGRMAGVDPTAYTNTQFEDVPSGIWYEGYLAWAAENQVVLGMTATTFCPDIPVTREQAATLMARYLKLQSLQLPEVEAPAAPFTDSAEFSAFAAESIEAMRCAGLVKGYTAGEFRPKANISRCEAAALFLRMYQRIQALEEAPVGGDPALPPQ